MGCREHIYMPTEVEEFRLREEHRRSSSADARLLKGLLIGSWSHRSSKDLTGFSLAGVDQILKTHRSYITHNAPDPSSLDLDRLSPPWRFSLESVHLSAAEPRKPLTDLGEIWDSEFAKFTVEIKLLGETA